MKIICLIVMLCVSAAVGADRVRTTIPFDADWRFLKSDATGADKPDFDDSSWRSLSVPHDWAIEGDLDRNNASGAAGAFRDGGVGWYRKHFTLPNADSQQRIFIEFDGVMANSDVWINGFHLGHRPYGYVGFRYDLTGHLNFADNQTNVLAVRADNSQQPASRWYSGAGIYRHVRLIVTDPIHVDGSGTFVSTPTPDSAQMQTTVINQSDQPEDTTVDWTILSPDGQSVSTADLTQSIPPGKSAQYTAKLPIKNPQLWDLDHPNLYQAVTTVRVGQKVLDDDVATFGIRTAEFKPATGFWLNGKNFKLKGVALHQDAGAVGMAVPLSIWERRLAELKLLGCNAIRTAHNPPSPEFLDLCDRMGFLVMDEMFDCWTVAKNPYDYHLYFRDWSVIDTADTVQRDRNHPSIVLYSIGNEIHDTPHPEIAKPILISLRDTCHKFDPTRPVTQALFRPNVSHDYDNGLADLLDVIGQNYRENEILAAHAANPSRKIIGTENAKDTKAWLPLRDNAPYAGQFLWTGVDYLGEGRRWPNVGNPSGLIDTTAAPRPIGFQRQSWWSDQPMVCISRDQGNVPTGNIAGEPQTRHIESSDWSPTKPAPRGENMLVYSNCEQVELLLNGKSLGTQNRPADDSPRSWRVQFEPGELKAIGRNAGQIVATYALHTAGKPAKIVLTTDRPKLSPDWNDVAFITASIVDDHGIEQPDAADLITFKITGPGTIIATDNGDLTDHEPFQAAEHHAYHGRCIAIVRATASSGPIDISASANNLTGASTTITAASAQ
jgi:beta-galactosidase